MKQIHSSCHNVINEDCSKRAHAKLGFDYQRTKECVQSSFSNDRWTELDTTNYVIESEIDYWNKFGSGFFPSIVINNRTYRGQLDPNSVLNAICAGFQTPPTYCK